MIEEGSIIAAAVRAFTKTLRKPYSSVFRVLPIPIFLVVLITTVLLNSNNYPEWSTELRNSLQANQKTGFIDGTIPKPDTEPDLSRWPAANSMIVVWIRTSIDAKVRSTVMFVPEAHKLWETLCFRFSVKNGTRIHQLRDEITNSKQEGQSVLEY